MLCSRLASLLPVAVLCVLAVAAAPAAAQDARACTSADLAGMRNVPLVVEERTRDRAEAAWLVPGRGYRAVVVPELAIGDERRPQDGSFTVTGVDGLTPDRVGGRQAWALVAPERGPVRLAVSWLAQALGDPSDVCRASETVTVGVRTVRAVAVGTGRLQRRRILTDAFVLPVRAAKLSDVRPVDVLLRIRTATTKPPAPRGPATRRATLRPDPSDHAGGFDGGRGLGPRWLRSLGLHTDVDARGVRVSPEGNIPFGDRLRFAFSVEVRQGGRRIGGMASGAVCRRVQLENFSVVRCRAVGLRQL